MTERRYTYAEVRAVLHSVPTHTRKIVRNVRRNGVIEFQKSHPIPAARYLDEVLKKLSETPVDTGNTCGHTSRG